MPLDIPALARAGVNQAWLAIASVLKSCTVRTGPTATYDAATDVTTIVWAQEDVVDGFPYSPEIEEIEAGDLNAFAEGRRQNVLIRASDLTAPPTTASTVEINSVVWQVKRVFLDPGEALYILSLLR